MIDLCADICSHEYIKLNLSGDFLLMRIVTVQARNYLSSGVTIRVFSCGCHKNSAQPTPEENAMFGTPRFSLAGLLAV
ncbi:MAG: hypothetical protein LW629_11085 [Burkholderiales bacterium]|nr:hypothetical protein [Burkholderiales bacterium]